MDGRDSAGYKRTLSAHNMIMLAPAGSEILGLSKKEDSDSDEMGICLESARQLLGFSTFEQDIFRSAAEREQRHDAPSQAGDVDLVVYGLRKFVRLALGGNPNIVNMLYIPQRQCKIYTPFAAELQEMRGDFLSRRVIKAFLGYMTAQRLRLMGLKGQKNVNREELESAYGYDTKYAMHLLRLGLQGVELAAGRGLQFPMRSEHIEYLQNVRNGRTDYARVIKDAQYYENQLEEYLEVGDFPDKPNYKKVEDWLVGVYRRDWYENPTAS